MSPLSEAVRVKYSKSLDDGTKVYEGKLAPNWTVASLAHGGYLLSLILSACTLFQHSDTAHPDPIHLSSHFLFATPIDPPEFEVRIRVVQTGRRFRNLTAEFVHDGQTKILSHLVFGVLQDASTQPTKPPNDRSSITLLPPHPYARQTPFQTLPSTSALTRLPRKYAFVPHLKHAEDPVVRQRLIQRVSAQDSVSSGNDLGKLEYAGWYELLGEEGGEKKIGMEMIPFFVDMGQNPPGRLPKDEGPGESWFPTITLTIDFKSKLPQCSDIFHPLSVGVYSTGSFIHAGRHEMYTEVWTSPQAVRPDSSNAATEGSWREKMVCIATATQMAVTLPIEINKRRGKAKAKM